MIVGGLTLSFARAPSACSLCEAKAELSLSKENAPKANESRGEAKRGVVRVACTLHQSLASWRPRRG